MSGSAFEQNPCHISLSGENFLTEFTGNAVVGLAVGKVWNVKTHESPGDSDPKYIFVIQGWESDTVKRVLTLDKDAESESAVNIKLEQLENPPSKNQLWTLEESITAKRYPPLTLCRIQSVARPDLSVAIGGHLPLPRLYANIAAIPNEKSSESQRWKLDYFLQE